MAHYRLECTNAADTSTTIRSIHGDAINRNRCSQWQSCRLECTNAADTSTQIQSIHGDPTERINCTDELVSDAWFMSTVNATGAGSSSTRAAGACVARDSDTSGVAVLSSVSVPSTTRTAHALSTNRGGATHAFTAASRHMGSAANRICRARAGGATWERVHYGTRAHEINTQWHPGHGQ
ncbi:MAG: hypothetical protein EOO38_15705, partial [Cytophagaceae bacterium]